MFPFPAEFIWSGRRVLIQFAGTGNCGYLLRVVAFSQPDGIYGYPKAINDYLLKDNWKVK
jgi:hypothetical protein